MSVVVTFGEIMARLATPGFQRIRQALPGPLNVTFAGAEASVAMSLAMLGQPARFVTALPRNSLADACVDSLRARGVDVSKIRRTPLGRMGLYFVEHGVNQRQGTVIYDREHSAVSLTSAEEYDFAGALHEASWLVVTGITPAISRTAAAATFSAVQSAVNLGIPVACDMNYRSQLWRWDESQAPRALASQTMRQLLPFVHLLVTGREDAVETLGLPAGGGDVDLCEALCKTWPNVKTVAMTRREETSAKYRFGGFLYDAETEQSFLAPVNAEWYQFSTIVDRFGAGDAFLAGLLSGVCQGKDNQTALELGTAAGCLAHSNEGDVHFSTGEEIEAVIAGCAGARIQR